MTTEEKAKAYDEAIKRAKELVSKENVEAAEYIFPELAENEDESIKKDIIIVLEREATRCFKETGSMPQWYDRSIAWLEKQGEQKQKDYSLEELDLKKQS